jgi:hypothetical protein
MGLLSFFHVGTRNRTGDPGGPDAVEIYVPETILWESVIVVDNLQKIICFFWFQAM